MRISCEVIVWYILPIIRREIASELVNTHGMSQAEVARRFGVTDAAISQYLKKKRGDSESIEHLRSYPVFLGEMKKSAYAIAKENADFDLELCRLCAVVRSTGLLREVSMLQTKQDVNDCFNMGSPFDLNE